MFVLEAELAPLVLVENEKFLSSANMGRRFRGSDSFLKYLNGGA